MSIQARERMAVQLAAVLAFMALAIAAMAGERTAQWTGDAGRVAEAASTWPLHLVLGAVALGAMFVAFKVSTSSMARVADIAESNRKAMEAHGERISKATDALHTSAHLTQDLIGAIRDSPCLLAAGMTKAALASSMRKAQGEIHQ